mmetsp:Transcript_35996/g.78762  ORF Transcript_35996/g.78762 Transcript_35996/m.78762 type:complete len:210 (-) Transcript_35996:127-756(-)
MAVHMERRWSHPHGSAHGAGRDVVAPSVGGPPERPVPELSSAASCSSAANEAGSGAPSTADNWNRLRDKSVVEAELGLSEEGAEVELHDASSPEKLIARGYRRIVFGDHGPYVELDPSQVVWESLPIEILKPAHAYYDEYYSDGGFVKLYRQKRSVEHKLNPPAGGIKHNREGGYADYKVGMCYVPPDMLTVLRTSHLAEPVKGRRWRR